MRVDLAQVDAEEPFGGAECQPLVGLRQELISKPREVFHLIVVNHTAHHVLHQPHEVKQHQVVSVGKLANDFAQLPFLLYVYDWLSLRVFFVAVPLALQFALDCFAQVDQDVPYLGQEDGVELLVDAVQVLVHLVEEFLQLELGHVFRVLVRLDAVLALDVFELEHVHVLLDRHQHVRIVGFGQLQVVDHAPSLDIEHLSADFVVHCKDDFAFDEVFEEIHLA